ncbi:MAG: phosphatase PAP2 family protein [Chromatiaceae bacterium]
MSPIPQPESGPRRRFLNAPVWLWLAFAGIGVIFILLPQLDLAVSALFYSPGVGFTARGTWFERLVHQSTYWFLVLGTPAMVGLWLAHRRGWLRGSLRGLGIGGRDLAFLLLVLVLGPGLLVNGILKEHWGRARPLDCQEFGGTRAFSPAFVPSDQGGRSFSSGHASGSCYWVVVALVLAPRRRLWLWLALGYSLLVAWARLAAGGHFLSDILVSWFIVALLAYWLDGLLSSPPPEPGAALLPPG